ncbi:MAG: hypothetical protein LC798_06020 [Chloroflexi bacterium]|nr:hypothetical protein [Chloroflexota bacterium]
MAVALAAAGIIHCLLTPEHMEISVVFGAGFLAAGIAQFGMAAMAVLWPSRVIYAAIIATMLGLTGLYAYNVVVGLPFHEPARVAAVTDAHPSETAHGHAADPPAETHVLTNDGHHDPGLVIGTGEPIDPYGAMTQLAQLSAAALALTLLVRRTPGGRAVSA